MVFGVGQFNYASHIWLGHTLVAMATKICDFKHRIRYNSACAWDTLKMLASTMGFSGQANLMVSVKLCSDDPCCHGNQNIGNFTRKFAITSVVYKIELQFLVLWYGFRGRPFQLCQSHLARTYHYCHGNENLRFSTQHYIRPRCLHPLGGFRNRPF